MSRVRAVRAVPTGCEDARAPRAAVVPPAHAQQRRLPAPGLRCWADSARAYKRTQEHAGGLCDSALRRRDLRVRVLLHAGTLVRTLRR